MPKRTFQPKKTRRIKRHGFRRKRKTLAGRKVIKRRMRKGRRRLTP